jgi:hypothetical protein
LRVSRLVRRLEARAPWLNRGSHAPQ